MAVDGTYNVELNTPMGKQTGTVVLKSEGNQVTGIYKAARGDQNFSGTADGDKASWSMTVPSPMGGTINLTFNVTADGNALNGSVQLGAFGTAPISGKKA